MCYIPIPFAVIARLLSLKEESDRQERMSHNLEPSKSSAYSTAPEAPSGATEVKSKRFLTD